MKCVCRVGLSIKYPMLESSRMTISRKKGNKCTKRDRSFFYWPVPVS